MVKTYSLKADGGRPLSPNFKVSEFRCHDGSDSILIADELVAALQALRDHYDKPVLISSAYRTKAYNAKTGGAADSQHVYGTAADIRIAGVNSRDIARWCEENLWAKGRIGGLGLYDYKPADKVGFVHIDVRASNRAQWVQTQSCAPTGYKAVGSIIRDHLGGVAPGASARPILRRGDKGEDVKILQGRLIARGQLVSIDGGFGPETLAAVRAVQQAAGLAVDGVAGPKTWAVLEG